MSRRNGAANKGCAGIKVFCGQAAFSRSTVLQSSFGQRGKNHFRSMGDNRKQGARGSARHAFALLPVANGLDGNAEPACEFQLRQMGAAAKVADRWSGCFLR